LAAAFQAPLVFLGTAAGTTAAVLTGEGLWIAGAALMASIIVITAVAILPLNAKLLRSEEGAATGDRRELVIRWYRLHAVRAFLPLAASALFVVALVRAG
jgi:Domain of unknown function (DUF1772)